MGYSYYASVGGNNRYIKAFASCLLRANIQEGFTSVLRESFLGILNGRSI